MLQLLKKKKDQYFDWKNKVDNKAKNALKNTFIKVGSKIPDANQTIGKAMANTPKLEVAQNIQNPVGRFAGTIAQETLNIPSKIMRNVGQTGMDISSGNIYTPQGARKFAGRTGENILDVVTMGKGKLAYNMGKNTLLKGIKRVGQAFVRGGKQGTITGTKLGVGYGTALEAQKDQTSLPNIFKQGAIGGVTGGITGGLLGGTLAGTGSIHGSFKADRKAGMKPMEILGDVGKRMPAGLSIKNVSPYKHQKVDGKSLRYIKSKTDEQDPALIQHFLDYVYEKKPGKKVDPQLEIRVRDVADEMGIYSDVSNRRLANKLGKVLDYVAEPKKDYTKMPLDEIIGRPSNTSQVLSELGKNLPRFGMNIQDVSGGKPSVLKKPPVQSDDVLPLLGKMKQEALPAGDFTAKTKSEAKKLFKRYEKAPELQITKKASSQPLYVSPQGDVSKSLNKATQADIASKVPSGDFEDIASPAVGFRDVYRNFERFFREKAPVMSKRFLEPFEESKDQMYKNLEKHATDLDTTIVKGLGIKKRSKESKAVQEFGEKTRDYASLVEEFGEEGAKRVATADKWFRSQYDRLIDEVNAVRTRIYPNNPNKIVPKRDDYYRHFREMKEGIAGLQNIFETPAGIDNTLAGISANTKPKSKFASFMQKRLGNRTDVDAVGGFLDYIRSAEYAKNVDPHIENFNRLRQVLAESGNSKNANYNNFLTFLDKFTNDLSGKTNTLDRGVQDVVGRQVFGAVDWLNKRVKSNVILGNASSSIAQIFAVPKGIANAGEKNYLKGLKRLAKSIKNDDAVMRQSPFLRERFSDVFGQFDNRLIQQPKKFAVWMITALDELGTKANWNAFYEKALAEGIENPIRYADDLARKMIGGRGIGEVPMVQKSRLFQLIAPFTLEVVNDWYALSETTKRGVVPLMKALVYTFLFNKVAENLRGSDVAFDPITAVLEGWENAGEEEGIKDKALVFGGRLAGEVASNLPGGAILASAYPEYGNDILPTRKDFFGQGDPTRFGGGVLAFNSLYDPLFKVFPPFGGNQLKKTLQGAETIAQGYSENKAGNVMYPVEQNPENILKSLLFGKYSTPEARDYFKEEKKPLGEIQSEIFRATGGSNYDDVMEQRMVQRKVDDEKKQALAGVEKVNAGGLNTGSSGEFVELSNGKFFDPVTKETFDSPKMAELGRAKQDFRQSDEAFRDLGDIVLRKDADGDVSTEKKTVFTNKLLTKRMASIEAQKGDYSEWMTYANQRYEILQEMLQDPTIDELDRADLEDDIRILATKIGKFNSYGGAFTKPKASRTGTSSTGTETERKITELERNPYKGLYAYDKKLDRVSLPREPRRPAVSLARSYGGRLRKPQITRIRRKI